MLITSETIIAIAGIITALGAIFGLIFSVYRWYLKQNRQDEEIARIQKENSLICFGLSACLDGLIQLGAILAVVTVFFYKLNPFSARKTKEQKHNTIELWKKVIIGCIPAGVIGILFNDLIDKYLMNWLVVAIMLIVVGIAFIAIEMRNQKVRPSIVKFTQLSYKTAFIIGVFQLLSLIPGTSRSGITIIGGMLFGCSRFIAAEYTFYLAIPVMFGASGLKLVKFLVKGGGFSAEQFFVVLLAMVVSYGVSMIVIKFLMQYIKRHNFNSFALYRIALGIIVLIVGFAVGL